MGLQGPRVLPPLAAARKASDLNYKVTSGRAEERTEVRAELPRALEGCRDTVLQCRFRKVEVSQLRTISPSGSSLSDTSRRELLALMIQRCQDESSGEANRIFSSICLENSTTQE